ncbi:MAG: cellulose-binding protein, partial [Polyangiaceae bacterium]
LAMKDLADGGKDVRMGGQDAVLIYNRQSDDATLPTLSPTGVADSLAPAVGAWTCIEVHVDETAGTIETWVDGKQVVGLTENGTPVADISTQWLSRAWKPSLVDFRLGWESYAGQTMTLWFDDVALASQRIGCGG